MRLSGCSAAIAAVVLGATSLACQAKEKHIVFISYVLEPPRPLPEGLETVAVIDSGVETQGVQQDERERKWSNIAADMIEAMLQNSGNQYGQPLNVAKRRDTRHILAEQDLALAGLVEGEAAAQAGRLLAVQGLITSKITINVDMQRQARSSVDWTGLLGSVTDGIGSSRREARPPSQPRRSSLRFWDRSRAQPPPRTVPPARAAPARPRLYDPRYPEYRGYHHAAPPPPGHAPVHPEEAAPQASPFFPTREVEEVSRHLIVQCSFSLIDAVTGRALVQYSPPPYRKQDTQSPDFLFGSLLTQSELDPVDHFIGELVEKATLEFVGMLMPTRVEYMYEVVGRGKEGEAGVRALRIDDNAAALRHFQDRYAKESGKEDTVFALAVAYELNGDHERALEFYRRAAALEPDERKGFAPAARRMAQHIGRIRPPSPAGTPASPAATGSPLPAPLPNGG